VAGLAWRHVRWLSADERAAWPAVAALMVKPPAALDGRLEADAGLGFFEYMVLAVLSEQPDRTRQMSDLAGLTSASLSRLSHTARRLERQGFLTRTQIPGRGRRTNEAIVQFGANLPPPTGTRRAPAASTTRSRVPPACSPDSESAVMRRWRAGRHRRIMLSG
jgi:hypothetical protein